MSIAVAIDRLGEEMARFGDSAFVLTTSDDGRPHISHVAVMHKDGVLCCTVGNRSADNARARAQIAVLWRASNQSKAAEFRETQTADHGTAFPL